jgi:hypothetical protein
MAFEFKFEVPRGDFFDAPSRAFRKAAGDALHRTAEKALADGREAIQSAGLGPRLTRGLKLTYLKPGPDDLVAPALIFHDTFYFSVFENGAQIDARKARRGGPSRYLWIPLPTTPRLPSGERPTARKWAREVGPLVFVQRPGRHPLLLGKPRQSFLKTVRGKKVDTIPLFVGVSSVTIAKRLSLSDIFMKDALELGRELDSALEG